MQFSATRLRTGKPGPPRSVVTALGLALLATCLQAQVPVDHAALDSYFSAALDEWKVPGFAVAIVKDDEVVFAKGYGVRDIETGGAVDENTLFAIASNTKAFTATALAMLVDDGKLGWDDRVVEYLPYFQLYDPWVTQEMRVRDLLCHRSGLGTFSGDLLWYGTSFSRADVIRRARYLPPAGNFRASYGYSNIMFLAAGEVVTAVTGRDWDEYVETELFNPLGMSRTVTSVTDLNGMKNVATPHKLKDDEHLRIEWYNWDIMSPAGGIISSAREMAQWIRLQLSEGVWNGDTIFSENAQRTMWTPHISYFVSRNSEETYPTTHFRGYGLGWSLMDYNGRKIASHGGGYDGMFSRVALVPEEELGLVILTNGMTSMQSALMYKVLDAYLGGAERDWSAEFMKRAEEGEARDEAERAKFENERVLGTKPSLAIEDYAGSYGGPMYGDATVTVEDDHLVVRFLANPDLVGDLEHWHFDTFVIEWRREFAWFNEGTVQFLLDPMGRVTEMKIDVPNKDLWFYELEFKKKD
ncbi:MAG: serine hydrolase [Gemmatimonadota bacterium]|nr:MAG: serine hydrolase [Gemmatimonadota bacterium]